MKKKLLVLGIVASLVTGVFYGCGSKEESTVNEKKALEILFLLSLNIKLSHIDLFLSGLIIGNTWLCYHLNQCV